MAVCGNGAVEAGEECDDGPGQVPPLAGDGCDATCQLEPNTYLEAEPNDDGVVAVLEDDFAIMAARALPSADLVQVLGSITPAGDEDFFLVTNTNMLATGYRVALVNGTCAAGSQLLDLQIRLTDGTILGVISGDATTCPTGGFTLLPGEAVVLGVVVNGDDATHARYQLVVEQVSLCGDTQLEGDEQCDPPDGMTCGMFCTQLCGDGTVGPGETCDDGPGQDPPASGDGCSATCQVEGITETERNDDGTPQTGAPGVEGNDFLASAANGPYSTTTLINAAFEPAGDEDVFAVTNPGATSVTFSAETFVSTPGNCPMGTDTGINLRDAAGTRLAFDDDDGEGNCSLLQFTLAPGQTLFVHVVDYNDDAALSVYQLLLRHAGTCGNARLEPGETCDDGGTGAMDGCSPVCAVEQNYTCTTPPGGPSVCVVSCGNGALEPPEQCDDGLLVPGDGCDASCLVEPGYTCNASGPGGCVFSCGDGLISGNESCDDGPLQVPPLSLDGCSSTCQLEIPTAVTETERNDDGTPSTGGGSLEGNDFLATAANGPFSTTTRIDAAISPVGDEDVFAFTNSSTGSVVLDAETFVGALGTCPGAPGAVDTVINVRDAAGTLVERDDEGGVNSCSKLQFALAPGQTLYIHVMDYQDNATIPSYSLLVRRVSLCGDGATGPGEACDDAGTMAGDGCSPGCQAEPNYTCTVNGGISTCVLSCGNNIIEPQAGESCDDGELLPGDGCDASCHEEPGFTCRGPGFGGCSFTCGSSSISGNEQCDDGNFTLNDGCSDTCQVDPGYACNNPPVGPSVCQTAPAHAQCAGALALGASLANQDTTFSGTLLSTPSCNGGQDQPVLFYSVLVPPRSMAVVQVNVAGGEPAFVYQLDGCATQACTAVTPLGGPGSSNVEWVNPSATPQTFLFAVGGDFARIHFGLTTSVVPLDAGAVCAMPLPVMVGNNGPFAAGGGADDLSGRCLPGVVGGVTYHALSVPPQSLVRLTVQPGSGWNVAARLLADCAAGSCLAQAAAAPPGLPDVITYSNATMAAQALVLAVGSTTAGGGGSYTVMFERFDLGAYATSSIPGACRSLSAPVTLATSNQDDGVTTLQPLGFPFSFFGDAVTQYSVTTNGFMQVYPAGGGAADNDYNNPTLLPDVNPPNGVIAPFWDDLLERAPPGTSSIRVETLGTTPNRVLVVEWNNWRFYTGALEGSVLSFQAHLFETSNAVEFHYCTMTADPNDQGQISGGSATVGMEDLGATEGVTWSADTAGSITPASGLRFLP